MGNDLSTLSGPEPGVSVSVTVNEAGKRIVVAINKHLYKILSLKPSHKLINVITENSEFIDF